MCSMSSWGIASRGKGRFKVPLLLVSLVSLGSRFGVESSKSHKNVEFFSVVMLQKFEISNGSISLISSFFTLCSKARVFEQWGLVTWKTHILREMRWSKEFSFTNICRFATWRVERIFQAIRQRSRDLANMKRRYFTPLLLPIDALIVLKKSVSFYNKESPTFYS